MATAQSDPRRPVEVKPPRTYKGRTIAQTMHYLGAPWLIRESREREEECSTLLECLGIERGDVVCDFGSGNGFYTLPICRLVGPDTKVLAVDIQKQMLTLLEKRAAREGLEGRVETILGTETDPKLPRGKVDLALLVDVYHELSHPEETLRALRDSLSSDGRIVLVEFRAEDPKVPIKKLHKMSKRQVLRELVPNGFRLVEQFDELPWQHVMFFGRAPDNDLSQQARQAMARASGATVGAPRSESAALGLVLARAFRLTGDDRYYDAACSCARRLVKSTHRDAHLLLFLTELDDLVEEPWLTDAIDDITGALLGGAGLERAAWPEWRAVRDANRRTQPADLVAPARAALDALDDEGRWTRDGTICVADYIVHMHQLCDLLEFALPR